MTADDAALAALTHLRDGGLVTDRGALNRGWRELTGRDRPATVPETCQHRGCLDPGRPFVEPAGTWCMAHLPTLWRLPSGNPWATPHCHTCGRPGNYPNHRNTLTRPACRFCAPAWMRAYLSPTATPEELID